MRVSLLSSGWDQVVPRRYGRQGKGASRATALTLRLLRVSSIWLRWLFREKDLSRV